MFRTLFRKKGASHSLALTAADGLYEAALLNTRDPVFYAEYGVPDSFDGRFDLLLVHIFIILHVTMDQENYDVFSQALFDRTFQDMDQTLREMGIGDMGVPKHMKRMMKAFNGRMHNYQIALKPEDAALHNLEGLEKTTLEAALKRNLYGTVCDQSDWNDAYLVYMQHFIQNNIEASDSARIDQIMRGEIRYINDVQLL